MRTTSTLLSSKNGDSQYNIQKSVSLQPIVMQPPYVDKTSCTFDFQTMPQRCSLKVGSPNIYSILYMVRWRKCRKIKPIFYNLSVLQSAHSTIIHSHRRASELPSNHRNRNPHVNIAPSRNLVILSISNKIWVLQSHLKRMIYFWTKKQNLF
jgi:hypothetical protein